LAVAQGVRLGVSKLRYHTQDFAYATFSLVRGKEVWRLIGATPIEDNDTVVDEVQSNTKDVKHEVEILHARVFSLLKRLLHGEEANESLFSILVGFREYIKTVDIDPVDIEYIECIVVLRILYVLGYVEHTSKENTDLAVFFSDRTLTEWSPDMLARMKQIRPLAVRIINEGLKASQL
jgi:recombinational DNA repair protein (RecF pathway)